MMHGTYNVKLYFWNSLYGIVNARNMNNIKYLSSFVKTLFFNLNKISTEYLVHQYDPGWACPLKTDV